MLKSCPRAPLVTIVGLLLALTLDLGVTPALGQGGDLFTAYRIPVDAEAKTAAKARDVALLAGQRLGLETVLRRLTLAEDRGRLPRLTNAEITPLVVALQVDNEKTSSMRYLANLTIEFKKDKVRSLLRAAALPFTETRAQPSLVLPVLDLAGQHSLFDDNPWLLAWAEHDTRPGAMLPLIIPIGDLQDAAAIDAALAVEGDEAAMAAIAKRYGANNILVMLATLVERDQARTLDLTLTWHGPLRSGSEISSLLAAADESTEALLARAVAETAGDLEETWKRQTLLQFDSERRLSARLPVEGLQDWVRVQRRLEQNGTVRKFAIASISRHAVQLHLDYLGDPDQLAVSLAQNDLELIEEDGFWILKLRPPAGGTASE